MTLMRSLYSLCLEPAASVISNKFEIPSDLHDDIRKCMSKQRQLDVFDGEYKSWCSNGILLIHFHYRNGERHGEHKNYYGGVGLITLDLFL